MYKVIVRDYRWKPYIKDLKRTIDHVFQKRNYSLELLLTNNTEIQSINHHLRNIDKPTNVLSYQISDNVGDVVLSYEYILYEIRANKNNMTHFSMFLLIHGILHLFGYDHENENDASTMEDLEDLICKSLNIGILR